MARYQCPSTPFSTPLSGSARQAEARIRNLFQCEKKRPPLPLLFLAALLILFLGCFFTEDAIFPPLLHAVPCKLAVHVCRPPSVRADVYPAKSGAPVIEVPDCAGTLLS